MLKAGLVTRVPSALLRRVDKEEGSSLTAGRHEGELIFGVEKDLEADQRHEPAVVILGCFEVGDIDADVAKHANSLPPR